MRPSATGQFPTGRYAVGRTADSGVEHIYRLGSPLAQVVLATARDRTLPVAEVAFDYAAHGARISDVQRLVGRSGWLRVSCLSIAGEHETEDTLLLAAVTDAGTPVEPEIAARILSLPASVTQVGVSLPSVSARDIARITDGLADQAVAAAAERSQAFLLQEMEKMDAWANDRRLALRVSLRDLEDERATIRKQLRQVAGDMSQILTLRRRDNLIQQRIEERESEIRTEARKIRAEADALLDDIERRLRSTNAREELFTIRWRVV